MSLSYNNAVFVTNVPYEVHFTQIKSYFSQASKVVYVDSRPGTACVYFSRLSAAVFAVEMFNDSVFFGRRIQVSLHKRNEYLKFPNKRNTTTKLLTEAETNEANQNSPQGPADDENDDDVSDSHESHSVLDAVDVGSNSSLE